MTAAALTLFTANAAGDAVGGDPDASRTVYAAVIALVLIGVALTILAVWLFRQTKVDRGLLAPLETMSDRKWRRLDPASQRRLLDEERPDGAEPLRTAPTQPLVDADFEAGAPEVEGFDDLADDPIPPGADIAEDDESLDPTTAMSRPHEATDHDDATGDDEATDDGVAIDGGVATDDDVTDDDVATDGGVTDDDVTDGDMADGDMADGDVTDDAGADDDERAGDEEPDVVDKEESARGEHVESDEQHIPVGAESDLTPPAGANSLAFSGDDVAAEQ